MNKIHSIFLVFCISLFMGCEKGEVVLSEGTLVRVGAEQLTSQRLEKTIDVRVKLACRMQPKMDERQIRRLRADLRKNGIEKYKQDYVIRAYARENDISLASTEVSNQFEKLLGGKKRAEGFRRTLTEEEREIADDLVEADLLFAEVKRQVLAKADISIAEDELAANMKKIMDYNRMAAATNALVYAQASNCWRRIVSGELSFLEAAKRYDQSGEDSDERIYWGEFPLSALSADAELCARLIKMKPGEITPPIEADNALLVVQLDGIVQNEKPGETLRPEAYYQLNRIFFKLPLLYDQPTEDELRTEMKKMKSRKVLEDFLAAQRSRHDFIEQQRKKGSGNE